MATAVDISNIALSYLGADAVVASISPPDGSAEAGLCSRFYPIARLELLDNYSFSFATKRVLLAQVTNPSTVWSYAYGIPSDLVNAQRVLQLSALNDIGLNYPIGSVNAYYLNFDSIDDLYSERGSADFTIEGSTLLTNEPTAVLVYTTDVTDTTKFSPTFTTALGMLLASYLAGPLLRGMEGAKVGLQNRQMAVKLATDAASSDANSSAERGQHVAQHLRARV